MNIAIIGYGIVGGGVHELLKDGSMGIHVKRVLDIKPIPGLEDILTDNIAEILGDPDIDCVVETIGGMHPALSYVTSALRAGKHVATSNKELISHALAPLVEGAAMHKVQIRFTASAGGGIPWLYNVLRQKRGDRLLAVDGIVNGTTNYILDAMANGAEFDAALGKAREMGYAELNASADLDGIDAQRKCAISASLAFDAVVEPEDIPALGIANIQKSDIDTLAAKGLTCKLMMYAARAEGGVSAYVEPSALGQNVLASHTPTNHNCISLYGERVGQLSFYGQGAGRYPTAENVVQDLLDIAANMTFHARGMEPLAVDNTGVAHAYYVRTAASSLVADIQAESWDGGILTKPVDVAFMHARAAEILTKDAKAFIAGVPCRA